MNFVVEQLKNWLKLAALWVDAPGFIDRFSLLNAVESRRVPYSDTEGFVHKEGDVLHTEIKDGRIEDMKDLSAYFYLFILTRSGRK